MAQLFSPGANTIARVVLIALVLLPFAGVGLAYGLRVSPYSTDQGMTLDQPVPFSHKHHVGDLGIDCRFCHTAVEGAAYAGMPTTQTCMTCHSQIWTNAAVLAPVRDSYATGTPIRWARIHRLAQYVYFNHAVHVAKGVGCSECHGAVHQMALMRKDQPMTMAWCLSCHRDPGPRLRPREYVFDTAWAADQRTLGQARDYLVRYHVRTTHLTDCSTCHR